MTRSSLAALVAVAALAAACAHPPTSDPATESADPLPRGARPFADAADAEVWLEHMRAHGYSPAEVRAASGLPLAQAERLLAAPPTDDADRPTAIHLRPYPGGRHPRLGFLEGAVDPQRETKISVFTPWDAQSYVVVDVPEAIWANGKLIYLAHEHLPTVWSEAGVALPPLEWAPTGDGGLCIERALPDGVRFGCAADTDGAQVRFELWLYNGSNAPLTDLRVQCCTLLGHAADFAAQTDANKTLLPPFAACRAAGGDRWVITGWVPDAELWSHGPCPCMHADPRLPDCAPGATVRAIGWLSFYEGDDLPGELRRIARTGWR